MSELVASEREMLASHLAARLRATGKWTAPYGILESRSTDRKYRSITFGIARTLDAEIRIYGPHYITLRYRRGRATLYEVFHNMDDIEPFLKAHFLSGAA